MANNPKSPRRTYNQFDLITDTSSPDGLARQAEVERRIEKALKTLSAKGEVLRRVHKDEKAARSTISYAYHGPEKIQNAVNKILAQLPDDLGYGKLDDNGNVAGTNKPPPFRIANQQRKTWSEFERIILSPRMLSEVKRRVLEAGGSLDTNKMTGVAKILMPGTMSAKNPAGILDSDITSSNSLFTAGTSLSSALADGASPASIEQLAQKRVAFRDRLKTADKSAKQKYIEENPHSLLAMEEMQRIQKINNRADKERIAKAERTPGTPEYNARVGRGLDNSVAQENAQLAWANKKENRNLPIAQALRRSIKARRRNRTAGGRLLNKAMAGARAQAVGAALSIIGAAVSAMVKFLSQLPAIAANVHRLAAKEARYNVPQEVLAVYEQLGLKLTGDERGKEMIGNFIGVVHEKLADVVNQDIAGAVGPMAALSGKVGGGFINAAVDYLRPDGLGDVTAPVHAAINDVAKATFQGITAAADGLEIGDAAARNIISLGKSFGDGGSQTFNELYNRWKELPDERNKYVLNEVVEKNGDFIKLMSLELGAEFTPYQVSGPIAAVRAENAGNRGRQLGADASAIKDGILVKILANLDPVINFLRQILRAVLEFANIVTYGQFSTAIAAFNNNAAANNIYRIRENDIQKEFAEAETKRLREEHGLTDETLRERAFEDVAEGKMPRHGNFGSWDEALNWFGAEVVLERATKNAEEFANDKYYTGEIDARSTNPEDFADEALSKMARANQKRIDMFKGLLETYGSDPAALSAGAARIMFGPATNSNRTTTLSADNAAKNSWTGLAGMLADINHIDAFEGEQRQQAIIAAFPLSYGSPTGVRDKRLNRTYRDPWEHLRDLANVPDMVIDLNSSVPHDPSVSSYVAASKYQREHADDASTIAGMRAVKGATASAISNSFTRDYMAQMLGEGAIKVEVKLSSNGSMHTVVIKNDAGKELGSTYFMADQATRTVHSTSIPYSDFWEHTD